MGHVFVDAELSWLRSKPMRLLVDTGATYTVLPADLVHELGITDSPRSISVTLADGSIRQFPVATVVVRLMGREAAATVLVAKPGAEPLLGVEVLEALGLAVDPSGNALRPTRAHGVLAVGVAPAVA